MPIKVVFTEVEPQTNMGTKLLDPLELKARHLGDRALIVPCHCLNQRSAEVAADKDPPTALAQDLTEQGRGGTLAVGASHGEQRAREKAKGQLDLTPYRHPLACGCLQERRVGRHARAGHHQINPGEYV